MTPWLYQLSVWIHVLAACAWVGSMLFFSIVIVPSMRRATNLGEVRAFLMTVGERYRTFGWAALALLFATGIANLHFRGVAMADLGTADFWSAPFGHALALKLSFIALVLLATSAHDVWMRAARSPAKEGPAAERYRRGAALIGRSTLVFSLVVVFFAVGLVRGLP